jgi:hypothetical protein
MSERRTLNSIKRVNYYLLTKAIEKVNCSYHLTILKGIDLNNLSQSDIDTINLFIFEETHPEVFIDVKKTPKLKECNMENIAKLISEKSRSLNVF